MPFCNEYVVSRRCRQDRTDFLIGIELFNTCCHRPYRTGSGRVQQYGLHFELRRRRGPLRTPPTTVALLRELLQREWPDLVVFEACAQARFADHLCRELGQKYAVANTNGEAWKWKNVKRKFDRDDALKLVRLAYREKLTTVEASARRSAKDTPMIEPQEMIAPDFLGRAHSNVSR